MTLMIPWNPATTCRLMTRPRIEVTDPIEVMELILTQAATIPTFLLAWLLLLAVALL
jgi:hypothetical protein